MTCQFLCLILFFLQHYGAAGWDVDFQPFFAVFFVKRVEVGFVDDAVVSQAVAAEFRGIGIEYHLVAAFGYEETVIREGLGGGEVEHEYQIATAVGQYLVAVVVPDFHHRLFLDILHGFEGGEHFPVEVT